MDSRGVTLIELLVVLGVVTLVLTTTSMASLSSFKDIGIQSDKNLLTDILLLARANAQSGKCISSTCSKGMSFGVHINEKSFILFQGESFETRDEDGDSIYPRSSSLNTEGAKEFVFNSPDGSVKVAGTTTIQERAVYVDTYGRIGSIILWP